MFSPPAFKQQDQQSLLDFIEAHPFASLISQSPQLKADHLPVLLDQHADSLRLKGHIAKANTLWKHAADGDEVLLIFHGPHAYISPNFYPSKKSHGKAVPTWNYQVVHVRGRLVFNHDAKWLHDVVAELSDRHEQGQPTPWQISDAPQSYIDALVNAIVGIEVLVDDISGQFKLSQNKSAEDVNGVIAGLTATGSHTDAAVAKQMQQLKQG